jgi:hypothetical protein
LGSCPGEPAGGGVMQRTSGARVARGKESEDALLQAVTRAARSARAPAVVPRFMALS